MQTHTHILHNYIVKTSKSFRNHQHSRCRRICRREQPTTTYIPFSAQWIFLSAPMIYWSQFICKCGCAIEFINFSTQFFDLSKDKNGVWNEIWRNWRDTRRFWSCLKCFFGGFDAASSIYHWHTWCGDGIWSIPTSRFDSNWNDILSDRFLFRRGDCTHYWGWVLIFW